MVRLWRTLPGRRVPPVLFPLALASLLTGACVRHEPADRIEQARGLRASGHYEEAVEILADLVRRSPGDFTPHYELALALKAAGRPKEALDEVASAIEADPASLDARALRGEILAALGRDEEALSELRRVVAADPRRPGVHRIMGVVHAREG